MIRINFGIIGLFILGILSGCAANVQYTPDPVDSAFWLDGLPANMVEVQVRDLRENPEKSDELADIVRESFVSAFSPEPGRNLPKKYIIRVDILEQGAHFTAPMWHGIAWMRVEVISPDGEVVGKGEAQREAHLFNHFGYGTAKEVLNEAFGLAMTDLMNSLGFVDIR